MPRRREILLLVGGATGVLLAPVLLGDWVVRYLVPALPVLLVGGGVALAELAVRFRS